MSKIFVQIASYRDEELVPTIDACIAAADEPENIVFGICSQEFDNETNVIKYKNDERFRIDVVDYTESRGCCWARARVNNLYDGEEYTLQLDSHHRFVKSWDTILKNMLELCDSNKPILTTYCPSYDPCDGIDYQNKYETEPPCQMTAYNFTDASTVQYRPSYIKDWEELKTPIKSRFFSGHMMFTKGTFITDVPYDPELYFSGEEDSMALRAFTHGYDLFVPHRSVIFHEYTRKYRPKHWEDFSDSLERINWYELEHISKKRLAMLFNITRKDDDVNLGVFGLGDERTIIEYQMYAGINFKQKVLHDSCKENHPPPSFIDVNEWKATKTRSYRVNVTFPNLITPFDFYTVIVLGDNNQQLDRKDYTKLPSNDIFLFTSSNATPHRLIFWRHYKGEWKQRIEKRLVFMGIKNKFYTFEH